MRLSFIKTCSKYGPIAKCITIRKAQLCIEQLSNCRNFTNYNAKICKKKINFKRSKNTKRKNDCMITLKLFVFVSYKRNLSTL